MRNATNSNAGNEKAASNLQPNTAMKIEIPKDILAPNHRKAYAMAYRAAYRKKHIRFVAADVRFSIARGWNDGERDYWEDADREAEEMLAEEAATACA